MGLSVAYWTNDEIKFLKENYEKMEKDELAKRLGRTRKALIVKMCRLRHGKASNGREFAPPRKELLEQLYLVEKNTPFEIAKKFKVSSSTVRRWLSCYGIPIRRPYTSNVKADLSETEKAYLAGYLDGDGTITVNIDKRSKARRKYGVHYDVSLISKNKEFIKKLQEMVGGNVRSFIYEDSRDKKKGYKLGFTNQASALAFLEAVSPYLILKKKQAELMVKFLEDRLNARRLKGNAAIISEESWKIIEEIRRLNHAQTEHSNG
jgi:transposase